MKRLTKMGQAVKLCRRHGLPARGHRNGCAVCKQDRDHRYNCSAGGRARYVCYRQTLKGGFNDARQQSVRGLRRDHIPVNEHNIQVRLWHVEDSHRFRRLIAEAMARASVTIAAGQGLPTDFWKPLCEAMDRPFPKYKGVGRKPFGFKMAW